MTALACTICARPSSMRLAFTVPAGTATYLMCARVDCVEEVLRRLAENVNNAVARLAPALGVTVNLGGAVIEATGDELIPEHIRRLASEAIDTADGLLAMSDEELLRPAVSSFDPDECVAGETHCDHYKGGSECRYCRETRPEAPR